MTNLMRHVIPRRFTCLLCGGECYARNCPLFTGLVDYIRGYRTCLSRTQEAKR